MDRAHHKLRVRPGNSDPQRAFVIRCHHYQEKEEILRRAGPDETTDYSFSFKDPKQAKDFIMKNLKRAT